MSWSLADTIVAVASPADAAHRGIVRLSGEELAPVLQTLFPGAELKERWQKENRSRRIPELVLSLADGSKLPCDLWYWPGRRSFTGEPAAELHTFGSPPLLQCAVDRCVAAGARLAQPGEFSLRAFLQGRIDLVQAEAIMGVVQSQSAEQFRTALRQLAGGAFGPLQVMRERLLDLLADLEAGLDFVDEDLEFVSPAAVQNVIAEQLELTRTWRRRLETRHAWEGSIRVVLFGLPNAGKSSLFNALVKQDRALTSNIAGTTTDFLSGKREYHGWQIEFVDTAGWLESAIAENSIDQQSQMQMQQQLDRADLCLLCFDLSAKREAHQWRWIEQQRVARDGLLVGTKLDLFRPESPGMPSPVDHLSPGCLQTSARTGAGVEELLQAILAKYRHCHQNSQTHLGSLTASRCAEHLAAAEQCLVNAQQLATHRDFDELLAIEIRQALEHIGSLVGTVYTDDLLGRIFSRFCIGK